MPQTARKSTGVRPSPQFKGPQLSDLENEDNNPYKITEEKVLSLINSLTSAQAQNIVTNLSKHPKTKKQTSKIIDQIVQDQFVDKKVDLFKSDLKSKIGDSKDPIKILNVLSEMISLIPSEFDHVNELYCFYIIAHELSLIAPKEPIKEYGGESMLSQLDQFACDSLDEMTPRELKIHESLLHRVLKLFRKKSWKRFEAFGMFKDIELEAGKKAKGMLQGEEEELKRKNV